MPQIALNFAQTFFIDPTTVDNSAQIHISAVDLYFLSKPLPLGTMNAAGVDNPGVTVSIYPTVFGVPKLDPTIILNYARLQYTDINTSSDASIPTKARFPNPVLINTGQEYAITVAYDRNAEFVIWKSTEGENLVGTTNISPGSSGRNVGHYYEYINSNPFDTSSAAEQFINQDEYLSHWNPRNDTDIKFSVYCARYAIGGVPVNAANLDFSTKLISYTPLGSIVTQANSNFLIPASKMEFMTFDPITSSKEKFVGGQMVYQDTFAWPGGLTPATISCVTGNNIVSCGNNVFPNGAAFNWNVIFPNFNASVPTRFVIKDTTKVNLRRVVAILSNTTIQVSEPLTITNASAQFLITPSAAITGFDQASPFGVSQSVVIMGYSSANSTVRFVNNTILSAAVVPGGTGYSNSDILYVTGYENISGVVTGGYKAIANLTTNSTGGILGVYFSNAGCGFVNATAITTIIANGTSGNTTSNTSAGSGAGFVYSTGATLRTDLRPNNYFRQAQVVNIAISDVIPYFDVDTPPGTDYNLYLTTLYQRLNNANTFSGYQYQINSAYANTPINLTMFQKNPTVIDFVPCFVSYSNEYITPYSNGATNTLVGPNFSTGVQIQMNVSSNNDFVTPSLVSFPKLLMSKYIINNDSTNEHTDQGNAWARGISSKINFARAAEDVLVYLTAYKPSNTNIEIYARLYNNLDPDAFDDKDWTKLRPLNANAVISSSLDKSDLIELSYSLKPYSNIAYTLAGSVTAANGSSVLTGIGSSFSTNATANVVVNDLIRIYSPLFPNNSIIAVVNSVANDTSITISTPITNNNFLGTTLAIDKIKNKHQAFNNIMNANVARYFNSSMMAFDGYDTMQIKTVLLSDSPNKIPRVDDIRAIGVSA